MKSEFCIDCKGVFNASFKYHAKNKCALCYRLEQAKKNKVEKIITTSCIKCGFEFDSINSKGKPVKRGCKNMCKSCYTRKSNKSKNCNKCGNEMATGSIVGLCVVCKADRVISRPRKQKALPLVEYDDYELIRRLLVRYKVGHNNLVDNFRVVDIYMDIFNNPVLLDTLTEGSQIVEMLRSLKKVFDFNKEDRINKLAEAKKKADHKAKYYKYKKVGKKKKKRESKI